MGAATPVQRGLDRLKEGTMQVSKQPSPMVSASVSALTSLNDAFPPCLALNMVFITATKTKLEQR